MQTFREWLREKEAINETKRYEDLSQEDKKIIKLIDECGSNLRDLSILVNETKK